MFGYVGTILVAIILLSAPSWRESRRSRRLSHANRFRRTAPASSPSRGKGPAVVLLHGFGDTGDMWLHWQLFWPRTIP